MSRAMRRYTLKAARRGNHVRGQSVTVPKGCARDLELTNDPAWYGQDMAPAAPSGPRVGSRGIGLYQSLTSFLQSQAAQVRQLEPEEARGYLGLLEQAQAQLEPLLRACIGIDWLERFEDEDEASHMDELEGWTRYPERALWTCDACGAECTDELMRDTGPEHECSKSPELPPEPAPRGGDELDKPPELPSAVAPGAALDLEIAQAVAKANARTDLQTALEAVTLEKRAHTIPELVELATAAGVVLPDPLPRAKADLVGAINDLLIG